MGRSGIRFAESVLSIQPHPSEMVNVDGVLLVVRLVLMVILSHSYSYPTSKE